MCGDRTTFGSERSGDPCGGSVGEDVERGCAQLPALERRDERRLVDEPAPRGVHQHAARPHRRELRRADHVLGVGRERRVEHDDVRPRQQVVEALGT